MGWKYGGHLVYTVQLKTTNKLYMWCEEGGRVVDYLYNSALGQCKGLKLLGLQYFYHLFDRKSKVYFEKRY